MMKSRWINLFLMTLMISACFVAENYRPTHKIVNDEGPIELVKLVPETIGDWKSVPQDVAVYVNPQQVETINRIYSQTLSRTYVNSVGDHLMLSIAYGEDQSDQNQLHLPDVCYPAQGFQIKESQKGILRTDYGEIRVKRLLTYMGGRVEPLTYWTTVGRFVVSGATETKLAQLKYGFRSTIPDGLIVRVSSITNDEQHAYSLQQDFVREFVNLMTDQQRERVVGF